MNQHQHDGDSEHDHISVSSSESNDAVSDIVESISSDPNGSIAGEPTEPDSGEPHAYDVPTYDSYDGGTAVGYEFSPSPFEHQVAVIHEIPSITSTNRVSDDDFSDFGFMRHDVTRPAFVRPDLPVRPFAFGYVCSGDRGIGRVQGDGDAAAGPPPLPSLPTTPVSIVSAPVEPQWFGLRDTDIDGMRDSHMDDCHDDGDDGHNSEYDPLESLMSHSDSASACALVPYRSMDSADTHVINSSYDGTPACTRCVCLAQCGACGRDLRVLR